MPSKSELTKEWISSTLAKAGYETRYGERDPGAVVAKHSGRPNITVKYRPEQNIILITHSWGLKSPGFMQKGAVVEAVNKANSMSWYDTLYVDSDGDLSISAYIFVSESITEENLVDFVSREADHFMLTIAKSGLMEWIK